MREDEEDFKYTIKLNFAGSMFENTSIECDQKIGDENNEVKLIMWENEKDLKCSIKLNYRRILCR